MSRLTPLTERDRGRRPHEPPRAVERAQHQRSFPPAKRDTAKEEEHAGDGRGGDEVIGSGEMDHLPRGTR